MIRIARARGVFRRLRGIAPAAGAVVCLTLLCAALLSVGPAAADQGTTFVLGELRIAPPTGYVNDLAGLLTDAQRGELEELCRTIDRETGVQIAVAIIPSLKGEEASDVKTRLFEAWGVGRKAENRGLLILHALQERRIEIEVGYGLEPILPDARVGRILDGRVIPHFRENQFFEGYRAGLLAIDEIIAKDPDARGGADAYGGSGRPAGSGKLPVGVLLLIPVLLYLFVRHPRLLLLLMLMNMGGGRGGGMRGGFGGGLGGGFGGGFGGFGGGMSGGGGAGRSY
jgi:uncharacterized protein